MELLRHALRKLLPDGMGDGEKYESALVTLKEKIRQSDPC